VDDAFRINSESRDHYLEVLENDDFPIAPALVPGQIVDLIEAPQGVEIAPGGRLIRLSEDLLAAGGSHQFQYTLGQGAARSTANVELTLYRYRETEVQAILEQIVAQAAEALQVAPETLTVGAEWRFTGRPMPDELAPGLENPLAGRYGLVLDLLAGDQLVRYAGDFQGRVVQLSHRPLETAMELRMSAVDGQGNPLERIASGETFFIEITAEDLRAFGQGVFAAAFDLSVPAAQLELTGDLQLLGAFDDLGGEKSATGIDEFVAVELLLKHPGGGPQPIVRIGVRAVAGGDVMLRLDPADSVGAELLLRGRDDLVSPLEVRFGTLELAIDGIRPTDTDANGATTPRDALRVINFLARHGSRDIEELTALSALAEAEQAEGSVVSSRRLDTNADGRVSALDALTVINAIARNLPPRAEGETLASPLETMPLASDWLAEDDRR
jgi:hypothetical protein